MDIEEYRMKCSEWQESVKQVIEEVRNSIPDEFKDRLKSRLTKLSIQELKLRNYAISSGNVDDFKKYFQGKNEGMQIVYRHIQQLFNFL